MDTDSLTQQAPGSTVAIKTIPSSIIIRVLEVNHHTCQTCIKISIYLPGKNSRTAVIHWKLYIMKKLKANLLLGINIIKPEDFVINSLEKEATLDSYSEVILPLWMTARNSPVNQTVVTRKKTVIPSQTTIALAVHMIDLPEGQDLVFKPATKINSLVMFTSVVDCHLATILIYSIS